MSGYVASARLGSGSPRFVRRELADRVLDVGTERPELIALDEGRAALLAPPTTPVPLRERIERFRDRWAQLTFYVTDPESWR